MAGQLSFVGVVAVPYLSVVDSDLSKAWVSKRVDLVDASGIRKVFDLAAKLKDPINLSIGLPDFDVPEAAKTAAIDAIQRGENRYTQTQGTALLRDKLHTSLSAELGRDVGEVLVTSGVSGGLLLAAMATLDVGDEAIFLDPYFVMYRHVMTMIGARGVTVDSYPDFRFHPEKVEAAITPRTKVLILNSPSNPTGVVMSVPELEAAVKLARKHNLLIIADEIYEPFMYDRSIPSIARLEPNVLLLRGFSKSHAMTGWRLGYAVGPAGGGIIQAMAKLQQYTYVCAPSPFQAAAVAAMDVEMVSYVDAYRRKRDIAYGILKKKFDLVEPQGAFYIFPAAPKGQTATEFVQRAIEQNVLVIPGNVFSARDTHFRVSYATTDEKLAKGCEILCSLV